MFSLLGKTAVVTGGGSGIGKAISVLFGKQGANVYILDMDETGGAATALIITEAGGNAFFKRCNIASSEQVKEIIDEIAAKDSLDIVVNNAGIAHVGNLEKTSDDDFERLISVNVKGVFHVLKAVIPYLKIKGGVILNMASVASSVGIPDRFAYTMTKSAVVGMTLSVAKDYLAFRIRCNCI